MQPWGAAIIGTVAGVVYLMGATLVLNILKVDDPVEAVGIHGFGGMWGVIATGLFANADYVTETLGTRAGPPYNDGAQRHYGWWMGDSPQLLFAQLIWVAVIIGWVSAMMAPFFFLMKVGGPWGGTP